MSRYVVSRPGLNFVSVLADNLSQNNDGTGVLDANQEGILDLLVSKSWAIKLATEAARTVLSVDQIIVAKQAGGPKPPGPNPVSALLPP